MAQYISLLHEKKIDLEVYYVIFFKKVLWWKKNVNNFDSMWI